MIAEEHEKRCMPSATIGLTALLALPFIARVH
jgi:hypothetical protein